MTINKYIGQRVYDEFRYSLKNQLIDGEIKQ